MTLEDIIRMARKAGINVEQGNLLRFMGVEDDLERFAALVVAAKRNKVAQWMTAKGYATGHDDTIEDLLVELEWQVAEREREACIKACDSVDLIGADECIAAIRARGKT